MGSLLLFVALVGLLVGIVGVLKPQPRWGIDTRPRALGLAAVSLLTAGIVSDSPTVSNVEPVALPGPPTSFVVTTTAPASTTSTEASGVDEGPFGVSLEVFEVIDGDTIKVLLPDGEVASVRLIGIDTPERGEEGEAEATAALVDLIGDRSVVLHKDVSETDGFGRVLAYLYVGDVFVNERMVAMGVALAQRYPPDISMATRLEDAQATARSQALGAWAVPPEPTTTSTTSTSTTTTTTAPSTTTTSTTMATTTTSSNCHPSYPTICLPGSPDLDCGEIPYRDFPVEGSDPHGFDRDNDGIGCES